MAAQEDWRSGGFRQKVISQIEEAVKRSGNPTVMMKNPSEMEHQVYIKAKTRVEYLAYVARLLVYIRDIKPITAPTQQQTQAASMGPQAGMRAQLPGAFQANKQQPGGVAQQVPLAQAPQVAKAAISLAQTSLTQQQQQAYTKSGLTQKQILHQHLQQQQQHVQAQQQSQLLPQQQHQALMQQQGLVLGSQNQPGHHQMAQQPGHGSVGQVAPPLGVSPVQQSKLVVQAVQGRGQHVSSPATGASVPSNSMCAPTPSSVPHTSLGSQVSVAPSPAPFIPSPAMVYAPSPSPQHINVAASPAAPASVPTPSTMNVQSPASVPNPGSVGAPAASPASLNPAEEQAYLDKLKELAPYVEPLKRMINKMNRELKDHSSRDLYKLKNLYDILTNPCRRLPLQALENSGNVLKKLITLKPPSAPTPPAPPTPSSSSTSCAPTTTTITSTTVAGAPLQTTVTHPTPPQAICKPLYDAVVRQTKSPMLTHTLQRTLTPLLQAMEGPPILPLPPPAKKIRLFDGHQAKCKVPHVLQGELARLCSRFKVKSGASIGLQESCTLLQCSIEDLNLPAVPPIEISVPQNYPLSSPECKTANYNANPFLQKVQKQLSSRLRHMPEMYSVTSLLDAWESSIRQACIAEVAVS